MSKACVYLLRSFKDKKHYIGWTTNLKRRLDAHNLGKVQSTKHRTPFELVGYEVFPTNEAAKDRERKLKKNNSKMAYYFKKKLHCNALSRRVKATESLSRVAG